MIRTALILTLVWSVCHVGVSHAEVTTAKTACISLFGTEYATADEARAVLLALAKEAAVQEIFGEFLQSRSQVDNYSLSSMDIETTTVGFVRIRGNPEYSQGAGLGEICIAVDAYVRDEDLAMLNPRALTKKVVVADPGLTLKEVEEEAKKKALLTALIEYDQNLKKYDESALMPLMHEARYADGHFIEGTTAYSIEITGTIYPIEILALQATPARSMTPVPLATNLPNNAFTASSSYGGKHEPFRAKYSSTGGANWTAGRKDIKQWLQVDLGKKAKIQGIGTKGRLKGYSQWVTSYKVSYSPDGSQWSWLPTDQAPRVFPGNVDTQTEVRHDLSASVVARFIRIHPASWQSYISMRVEVYGSYLE